MVRNATLRSVGVAGLVAAFFIYARNPELELYAFVLVVFGVIGFVSPEILDELPFGPSKGE